MKLSEFIKNLQDEYNKYGDGTVFTFDDCATREAVGIEADPTYEYKFDSTGKETRELTKVEYQIYGYGYSY